MKAAIVNVLDVREDGTVWRWVPNPEPDDQDHGYYTEVTAAALAASLQAAERENERLRRIEAAAQGLFVNRNGVTDPGDPAFVSMWKAIADVRAALGSVGTE